MSAPIIVADIRLSHGTNPATTVRVNFKAASACGKIAETFCEVPFDGSTRTTVRAAIVAAAKSALANLGDGQASGRELIVAGDG